MHTATFDATDLPSAASPDRNLAGSDEFIYALLLNQPIWPNSWGQNVAAAAFFLTDGGRRFKALPDLSADLCFEAWEKEFAERFGRAPSARDAWTARTPASTTLPDGYLAVPLELSPDMVEAICASHTRARWPDDFGPSAQVLRRQYARDAWRTAMDAVRSDGAVYGRDAKAVPLRCQEALMLAGILRGMTECGVSPDNLWVENQPDGDPFVARAAELLEEFAAKREA